jgi:drug/metabolite transporter (DMT)-like permease
MSSTTRPRKEPVVSMGVRSRLKSVGVSAALSSAVFLGLTPIFGKQAIQIGFSPIFVVAMRTFLATCLLLVVILLIHRKFLYIYPAGLIGCVLAGSINGTGSLFYYSALGRINASTGHLIYMSYPLFAALWLWFDYQPPSRLTLVRLLLIPPALILLVQSNQAPIDIIGVFQMLVAGAFYALQIPVNQRVLLDMPAPTVTFYTLLSMSLVVVPVAFLYYPAVHPFDNVISLPLKSWAPVISLTLVTFLSRLTLFIGVKRIGGLQTALLGVSEVLVTLFCAFIWLGESFNEKQWLGAGILIFSLLLSSLDKSPPKHRGKGGWLSWINPHKPSIDMNWRSLD